MNDWGKFEAFLDTVRMPVFVLVIIAAICIDYADRSYFEQAFSAPASTPPAAAVVSTGSTPSTNSGQAGSSQATTTAQASAQITVDNPSALPRSVTTGQIVSFSFTIENTTGSTSSTNSGQAGSPQAGMAASFPYKVYVDWNTGEEDVIDENVLTLAAGQSKSIPEELKFEQATDKGKIFIQLQNTNQVVQFALPAAS